MSEDRTQAPSKHRRQLAREQGLVAHSPELTAAAGWLGAVLTLGAFRDDLARAMVGLVQGSMMEPSAMATDPAGVASRVRGLMIALSWPLGVILAAFAASAFVAHQMQVRGLWTASLIAPDLGRLWTPGRGPGLGARSGTVVWSLFKAVVIVIVSAGVIYSGWGDIQRLSSLEVPELARTAARSILNMTEVLAGVLVVLGLLDYGLRYFRVEAMLMTTSQEQREDQRTMEGDVAVRAQRRRIARLWRIDSADLVAGASLALTAPGHLTVVLSGGRPPKPVTIRTTASGEAGRRLRRTVEAAGITLVDAGSLARRLAQHPDSSRPIPVEFIAELAAIWPPQALS